MQEAQQEGGLSYQPVNIIDPRMSKALNAINGSSSSNKII
jgi:hypothetical protein